MKDIYESLKISYEYVRSCTNFVPEVALVLGSGLGDYAEKIEKVCEIDYKEIVGFPVSTVLGHEGRFIFGRINGVPAVIMQGRVHYYEGYSMSDVVMPIRLMHMLGAKVLFLTNACGGINTEFSVGDLMLISGHISSFAPSPLVGENIGELGTRFPDMSDVYDEKIREIILKRAEKIGLSLKQGVYIQTTGPNYETPEEIKMYRILGADAVGMSTACEAIAARHMDMKVCGISCITNMAAGILKQKLTHSEIKIAADKIADVFQELVSGCVSDISRELKKG
ncbi:MAG TPA: purine-nucleoside phosphorylase [Clostridia bacterium]|nr:purine-nucleoside phosphorylase [Clostridia bacterium]